MKEKYTITLKQLLPKSGDWWGAKVDFLSQIVVVKGPVVGIFGKVEVTGRENALREAYALALEADARWIRSGGRTPYSAHMFTIVEDPS